MSHPSLCSQLIAQVCGILSAEGHYETVCTLWIPRQDREGEGSGTTTDSFLSRSPDQAALGEAEPNSAREKGLFTKADPRLHSLSMKPSWLLPLSVTLEK